MSRYIEVTKTIHSVCTILSFVWVMVVLALCFNSNWMIDFYLWIAFYTLIPAVALNGKLWIDTTKDWAITLQWGISLAFLLLIFSNDHFHTKAFAYYRDLPRVLSSNYSQVTGKPNIDVQVGGEDRGISFEISGVWFWNVNQNRCPISENKTYTITYLPNTMWVLDIQEAPK
ncbi:MAG: hypothetical protein ACM3QZ_10600 [Solirubrobacterales bacterium]